MENIQNIMDIMEQIEYGFLDNNGNNIFDDLELERKLFEESNIKNETYFIYIDDKNYLPSHTFLVYYVDNKVYWF